MAVNRRIGLLATGDEIIQGDILNTNCQYIANQLFMNNLSPGKQLVVSDDQAEIEQALHYLMKDHLVVITIGGLGPTSDDRTRFALAAAVNKPLVFDETCWKHIVTRLTAFGLEIPESNKQQCLFPEGASIIPNENGTACACHLRLNEKQLFMLPGPPKEIKPIIDSVVIPQLIKDNLQTIIYRKTWLLMGIGEGNLAEKIDALAVNSHCQIGYRVRFPYLELKLSSENNEALATFIQTIQPIISPFIISENLLTASEQFRDFLKNFNGQMIINDHATQGLMQSQLVSPNTIHAIFFDQKNHDLGLNIEISGLDDYWNKNTDQQKTELMIHIENKTIQKHIMLRGKYTLIFAVELACWEILQYLREIKNG